MYGLLIDIPHRGGNHRPGRCCRRPRDLEGGSLARLRGASLHSRDAGRLPDGRPDDAHQAQPVSLAHRCLQLLPCLDRVAPGPKSWWPTAPGGVDSGRCDGRHRHRHVCAGRRRSPRRGFDGHRAPRVRRDRGRLRHRRPVLPSASSVPRDVSDRGSPLQDAGRDDRCGHGIHRGQRPARAGRPRVVDACRGSHSPHRLLERSGTKAADVWKDAVPEDGGSSLTTAARPRRLIHAPASQSACATTRRDVEVHLPWRSDSATPRRRSAPRRAPGSRRTCRARRAPRAPTCAARREFDLAWQRQMFDAGWAGISGRRSTAAAARR